MQQHGTVTTGDKAFDDFANALEIEDETAPEVDEVVDDGAETPEAEVLVPAIDEADGAIPPAEALPAAAETVPPAAAPTAPAALEQTEMQHRVEQLEQQNRAYQEQQQRAQLDRDVAQATQELTQRYEAQGFDPEQAKAVAQTQIQYARQAYEAQLANQRLQQESRLTEQGAQSKLEYVFDLQQQFGVTPAQARELVQLPTRPAMLHEARRMKEVNDLRSEVTKLKQAKVPAGQAFDNGRSTAAPSSSHDSLLDRYNANPDDPDPKVQAAARLATLGY